MGFWFYAYKGIGRKFEDKQWPKNDDQDLHRDGGFDGGPAYYFAFLAEDSELMDSHGFV